MPAVDIQRTIEAVWRIEGAKIIASLARRVGDLELAEDLAQDAVGLAVQAGAVAPPAAADEIMQQVHAAGFAPRVGRVAGLFKVRVGSYATREEAQRLQADIRRKLGGSPFVVEDKP